MLVLNGRQRPAIIISVTSFTLNPLVDNFKMGRLVPVPGRDDPSQFFVAITVFNSELICWVVNVEKHRNDGDDLARHQTSTDETETPCPSKRGEFDTSDSASERQLVMCREVRGHWVVSLCSSPGPAGGACDGISCKR